AAGAADGARPSDAGRRRRLGGGPRAVRPGAGRGDGPGVPGDRLGRGVAPGDRDAGGERSAGAAEPAGGDRRSDPAPGRRRGPLGAALPRGPPDGRGEVHLGAGGQPLPGGLRRAGRGGLGMRVLQIVPHLPPPYEGVGTYAAALAGELGGETRFLVGDPAWQGGGNGAAAVSARTAAALLDGIGKEGTVLLHYANYGYQRRGCPAWLVEGMERWRGRLVTVFHEVYASAPPWRSSFWLRPTQRRLAAALARRSDALATTLDLSARLPRPWTGGREIAVLPVFSTVGEPAAVPPFGERARRIVVFGGAGVRGRAYGP